MSRDGQRIRWRGRVPVAVLLLPALLMPGCSSSSLVARPVAAAPAPAPVPAPGAVPVQSPPPTFREKITRFFAGSTATSRQPVAGAQADVDCPVIDIRQGASTLTVGPTGENAAMSLQYQGTFLRAARECAVVSGQLVMKVGVEGRIIVGPAGGPGQVNVPLRLAVVDEAPSGSKTILTRLIMVPVIVNSADDNPIFSHVEEGLAFPLPSAADLENYVVYIGFDPLAAQAQEKEKERPKPKPKRKPKLRPTANAN